MKVLLFLGPHWAESHMPLGCIPAPFFLETSGLLGSCPVVPIELVTFVSVGFSPLHYTLLLEAWALKQAPEAPRTAEAVSPRPRLLLPADVSRCVSILTLLLQWERRAEI